MPDTPRTSTSDVGPIFATVLCGGDGERMDYADKPLQLARGKPLIGYVLDRLAPQVAHVAISANRHLDHYDALGVPVHPDLLPGRGPLEGVRVALARSTTELTFVCPGDAPWLPRGLVAALTRALDSNNADIAVPHDGTRRQNLFLLMRRATLGNLTRYLDDGQRSVHGWLAVSSVAEVAWRPAGALDEGFVNINTHADLEQFEARLQATALHKPER